MGSGEVKSSPMALPCLALSGGHWGMCLFLPMRVCVFLWEIFLCVIEEVGLFFFFSSSSPFVFFLTWKGSLNELTANREKSPRCGGKQAWLEVGNYCVGDNGMGQIRGPRFSSIGKSPVGSCECSSTRTAHADDMRRHRPFLQHSFTQRDVMLD